MIEYILVFLAFISLLLSMLAAFWLGYKAGRRDEVLIRREPQLDILEMDEDEEYRQKTPEEIEKEIQKEYNTIIGADDEEDDT